MQMSGPNNYKHKTFTKYTKYTNTVTNMAIKYHQYNRTIQPLMQTYTTHTQTFKTKALTTVFKCNYILIQIQSKQMFGTSTITDTRKKVNTTTTTTAHTHTYIMKIMYFHQPNK